MVQQFLKGLCCKHIFGGIMVKTYFWRNCGINRFCRHSGTNRRKVVQSFIVVQTVCQVRIVIVILKSLPIWDCGTVLHLGIRVQIYCGTVKFYIGGTNCLVKVHYFDIYFV